MNVMKKQSLVGVYVRELDPVHAILFQWVGLRFGPKIWIIGSAKTYVGQNSSIYVDAVHPPTGMASSSASPLIFLQKNFPRMSFTPSISMEPTKISSRGNFFLDIWKAKTTKITTI
jgi:hypothetical protein